ncbi:MAG: hypothetical protein ACM3H7_04970 [Acidobacteriaceae bacterium]
MSKLLGLKPLWSLLLYVILDVICIGMGMGVPFFCILLGFPLGWLIVMQVSTQPMQARQVFRRVLLYAMVASGVTFLLMLILWTPFATTIFDPGRDLAQTGIPLILYEPRLSFVAWIILMILISPFLQLLATIFSAYLALLNGLSRGKLVTDQLT